MQLNSNAVDNSVHRMTFITEWKIVSWILCADWKSHDAVNQNIKSSVCRGVRHFSFRERLSVVRRCEMN